MLVISFTSTQGAGYRTKATHSARTHVTLESCRNAIFDCDQGRKTRAAVWSEAGPCKVTVHGRGR